MNDVATFLLLFCLTSIITGLFVAGFSGIGFGLLVIEKSYEYHDEASALLSTLGATLIGLYICDAHRWPLLFQEVLAFFVFLAIGITLLLLVSEMPFGPLCVFTVLIPTLLVGIKFLLYPNMPGARYSIWIFRVLVTQGILLAVYFFVWTAESKANMWDSTTRAHYSDLAHCRINYDNDLQECEDTTTPDNVPCFWKTTEKLEIEFSALCTVRCLDVYEECEEAFITWANPGLAALSLLVIGFVTKYLKPEDPHSGRGVAAVVRFVAIFLFLFWIYASMAGAGDGLSSSLIAFSISLFIGAFIVMAALFWRHLHDSEQKLEDAALAQVETYKDLLKGLLILSSLPLIVVYLIVSVINQGFRRVFVSCCPCLSYPSDEKEHKGWLTKAAADQIQDFKTWDHSKVLTYAVYWGYGYVFFNVLASKFTTLFLSWLIEYTSTMSVLAVTLIVTAVGMVLFMLPPIPGIPVYLATGIVIVSVGQTSMGLWSSIAYACFVSLVIKLLGCMVQQKVIGELFGKSAAVRQMVGINSEGIRAMNVVLSDPKFTANKVYVLVGGPDWPVSVLCGMLGLDTFPILLGTLPVVSMIVPTVLAGSFAFMGSIEDENGLNVYPWADTMGAVASAVIAGAMFFFMLSAAGAVKDTFQNQRELIDAIPIDDEVKRADELVAKKSVAYDKVAAWGDVPAWAKLCLILSVVCMIGCCVLLVGFNAQCFAEYDLMYTINEHLGGKWYNLIRPLGRYALLLALVAFVLLQAFQTWATREMDKILEGSESEEAKLLVDTEARRYT